MKKVMLIETVPDANDFVLNQHLEEMHSLAKRILYCENGVAKSDEVWQKKEYQGVMDDNKVSLDRLISIFKRINKPVIVKFDNGEYTIRPDNCGDTIMGTSAHNAMYTMDRINSFKQREFEYRVRYVLSRMASFEENK